MSWCSMIVYNIPIIQAGVNGTHIGKLLFQIQDFNGHRDISFIKGYRACSLRGEPGECERPYGEDHG